MTMLMKRMHIEYLLVGVGFSALIAAVWGRLHLGTEGFSELDVELAAVIAGFLILFGLMRKTWREGKGRQWIWFVYGAIATIGMQLFARVFMERFSDFYLSLWLQAFKAGLI